MSNGEGYEGMASASVFLSPFVPLVPFVPVVPVYR
jgi:hypothetical protein